MPAKQLLFRNEARAKLLRGATALADPVRITLGPRSKSVLIAKNWGPPIVCNDGVTIAKELELKDVDEDLGVKTIRQAAERTGDAVGDGTSTATLSRTRSTSRASRMSKRARARSTSSVVSIAASVRLSLRSSASRGR
jgi:chaperonin GroEL (HSP60 family)